MATIFLEKVSRPKQNIVRWTDSGSTVTVIMMFAVEDKRRAGSSSYGMSSTLRPSHYFTFELANVEGNLI